MSREIDRKIAELMGENLTGFHWDRTGKSMYKETETGVAWRDIPDYSSDWNAMRLLVEWLQGKGLKVTFDIFPIDEEDSDAVFCYIFEFRKYDWHPLYESWEATAPLALCKAVLSLPMEVLE